MREIEEGVSRASSSQQPIAQYPYAHYWEAQAKQFGTSWKATTDDYYLKVLEHKAMLRWLTPGIHVLDVGCGNGYTAAHLVLRVPAMIYGLDYSGGLLSHAARRRDGLTMRGLQFVRGDGLFLPFRPEAFDAVITCRVVMNLPDFERQMRLVSEIGRVLKPRGLYLCIEETEEGLLSLNHLRARLGIYTIATCYRNCLLTERAFLEAVNSAFSLVALENFSSSYYFVTRLLYARLVRQPKYNTWIHWLASKVPNLGSLSPLKMFVLRRLEGSNPTLGLQLTGGARGDGSP